MTCIELFGCTSAGKSTFASHILQFCRDADIGLSLGEDFLLDQFHLGQIGSSITRAVLVNLISVLLAIVNVGKYRHFYGFAFKTITHLKISWREKLYICRNILKNIGIYEIAHVWATDRQVILLDEGPLQCANMLFVHVTVALAPADISEFGRVVPLSDAAVYLREWEDVLVRRTLARGHKRIRKGNSSDVQQFVHSAINMFELLVREPTVQSKLFIVNKKLGTASLNIASDSYKKFVLNIIRVSRNEPMVDDGPDLYTGLNRTQIFPIRNSSIYKNQS